MSTLTEEQRPAAPPVRDGLPSPVFVDGSGVRRAWTVRVLVGVAAVCVAYLLVLGVGMVGGATPGALLPWPSGTTATGRGEPVRPAKRVAPPPAPAVPSAAPSAAPVPGPRHPSPTSPRIPSPAVPAPIPAPSAPAPTSSAPVPAPSVSPSPAAVPTTVPGVTHGRSDRAPGHLKRTVPPPSATRKPAPTTSPTPPPTG